MAKVKYYYNKQSLRYEKVEEKIFTKFLRAFGFLCATLVFALVIVYLAYNFLDSPKEKMLKRELTSMKLEYKLLNKKVDQMDIVLEELEERDDNIYRVIFEAEPIAENARKAGIGGSDRYSKYSQFDNGGLMEQASRKIDKIGNKLAVQSTSYDEISKLVKDKEKLLASIPSIQPISGNQLRRMASGFGMRIDPHYKIKKFHAGMDFTAPRGTEVYATGDGVVELAKRSVGGYGKQIIINHGYGFRTRYAHLNAFSVELGQKVKRGQLIGLVGSTGKSTAPHLHYEVLKNGKAVNPINYYFNDLTPEEYEKMLEISAQSNQSFD